MEVVVTTAVIICAKLQSNRHHQQTNTQFFGRPDAHSVAQHSHSVAATSPLRQPTTTGRAALQAQHLRPKGICGGRSIGVELSA